MVLPYKVSIYETTLLIAKNRLNMDVMDIPSTWSAPMLSELSMGVILYLAVPQEQLSPFSCCLPGCAPYDALWLSPQMAVDKVTVAKIRCSWHNLVAGIETVNTAGVEPAAGRYMCRTGYVSLEQNVLFLYRRVRYRNIS